MVRKVSVNPGRFSTASILQNLFKEEIAQSGVLAQVSGVRTGLASVAPVEPQPGESDPCGISEGARALGLPQPTLAVSPQERSTTETEASLIGTNTRLGAVEVPTAVTQAGNGVMGTKSLLEVVAENPKSSFFSAPARTGKGVTIAACIRMVQKRVKAGTLSNVIFWAMTPKQDPQGKRKKTIGKLCYVARPAARTVSI